MRSVESEEHGREGGVEQLRAKRRRLQRRLQEKKKSSGTEEGGNR